MNMHRAQGSKANVFCATLVFAVTAASCEAAQDGGSNQEPAETQTAAIDRPVSGGAVPIGPLPPLFVTGCADGSVEQVFAGGIVGCAGSVTYPNRATLCASGYHPLSAMVWRTSRGSTIPTHHYWTDDVLSYSGTGTGACTANYASGNSCPTDQPMHVCARTNTDPEGNRCNWFDCSFDSGSNTPNEYFGGCAGNTTAGTLCVPDSGCADGSVEQTFTRGMVGCAGAVTLANAQSLCTAGYMLAYDSDWLRYRVDAAPTHDYWVASAPTHFSGSAAACVATTNASDPTCPADTPMRVCVSGGTDPEGNHCNWSNCGSSSSYSTAANEYMGGCFGNTTAGALCVPYKMCADGRMEQQWNRHIIGCSGNVSWGNRDSLCGPRQIAVSAPIWTSMLGNKPPTHNYWVSDKLNWSGFGSNNCSATTSGGNSCGMDDAMHVCTSSGSDAEGNSCVWTHCGLNATSPDEYLGGCGATAGTICMTGP